jgi:hypothetical protein
MDISNQNCLPKTFEEQWTTYTSLYWSRFYSYFDHKNIIFPKEFIVIWGHIPYRIYKTSRFYNSNRIEVMNQDLNVYYYVRKINNITMDFKFFAFVNVIGVKDLVQTSIDEDHLFLKSLYDTKIGIHSIFDHEYKDHCWDSLVKEIIE